MQILKVSPLIFAFYFAALISGCGNKTSPSSLPEVNDENCESPNPEKMKDKEYQKALAEKCLRESRYRPSSDRKW